MKPQPQTKVVSDQIQPPVSAEKIASPPPPAKKKLSLEVEDISETMTRLERKISP